MSLPKNSSHEIGSYPQDSDAGKPNLNMVRRVLPAFAIVGLTFLVYLPVLRGGFVWDDMSITSNDLLRTPAGLAKLWLSPTANTLDEHYWPLTYSVFWLEYQLWGLRPGLFHAVNIAFHAANCILIWLLARKMAIPGGWFAAILFAVHPIHVESVAWIIELKDVLSTFLALWAFWFYLDYLEFRRTYFYLAAVAAFAFGMLAKSMVVTLPALMLVYHWWHEGRIRKGSVLQVAPFAAIGLGIALVDAQLVRAWGIIDWGLTPFEKAAVAVRALGFYTLKILMPWPQMAIYPRWEVTQWLPFGLSLSALALVLFAGWAMTRRGHRGPIAAMFFFVIALLPVVGLIPFGYQRFSFVADRYVYLPSIAPILALGALASWQRARVPAIVVLTVFGILTVQHSALYGNAEDLWRSNIRLNWNAWEAHHQLGCILCEKGQYESGIASFNVTLRQYPGSAMAHNNLGNALLHVNRREEAGAEFRKALELSPNYAQAENGLGLYLAQTGKTAEARQHFERAAALKPGYSDALDNIKLIDKLGIK